MELSPEQRAQLRRDALQLYAREFARITGDPYQETLTSLLQYTEKDFTEVRNCDDHWLLVIHPSSSRMDYPSTLYVFCDIFLPQTIEIKMMVQAFDTNFDLVYDKFAKETK